MGMKHIVVVATALCVAMIGAPVAQATNHGQTVFQNVRSGKLHRASVSARLNHALAALSGQLPHIRTAAPSKQDAASFHIDENAYSPATVDTSKDEGIVDNPTADQLFFRDYHSKNYEDLKRVTGYFEAGRWTPSGASSQIVFAYQASTFADTATAQAAFTDAQTTAKAFNGLDPTKTDCSTNGVSCYALVTAFKDSNNQTNDVIGYVAQFNQCLAETRTQGSDALMTANVDQVVKTIQTITAAALANLLATCSGTGATSTTLTYNVVRVQFQKPTQSPQPTDPALKKAKPGANVSLVGVLAVTAGPASVSATVSYVIKRSGKIVKQDSQTGTIQPDPNNDTAAVFTFKLPKKVGTYKATMTFQLADQTQQGTASIKVAKK